MKERQKMISQFLSLADSLFSGPADSVHWTRANPGLIEGPIARLMREKQAEMSEQRTTSPKEIADLAYTTIEALAPVPTKEVLRMLQANDQFQHLTAAALSTILSRDDRFISDRSSGWSLDPNHK